MEQGLSIEQLRDMVSNLRKDGLNSQQIADELSLSQDTISWLLAESSTNEKPEDVRIGWRTIGVRPQRIAAIGAIRSSAPTAVDGIRKRILNSTNKLGTLDKRIADAESQHTHPLRQNTINPTNERQR